MAHSPHRRWRGHCLHCANPGWGGNGKIRGAGPAASIPFRDLRKLGRRRRLNNWEDR